jgi:hypothetical protein
MGEIMEAANITTEVLVREQPIKGKINQEAPDVTLEQIRAQAELGRQNLVDVDPAVTYGTCPDERKRIGLRSGSKEVRPRPAAFGGPNVYALYIAELTGALPEDGTDGKTRLRTVTRTINGARIKSGGHEECKANMGFADVLAIIASGDRGLFDYARDNMGDAYNQDDANEAVVFARRTVDSHRYDGWTGNELAEVLDEEEFGRIAGEAIEVLAPVQHEGYVVQRVEVPGKTIDQTAVYDQSPVGPGSYDIDDPYAEAIEDAVVAGPEAEHKTRLARVAREMVIAAIAGVVPNPVLYQSVIK